MSAGALPSPVGYKGPLLAPSNLPGSARPRATSSRLLSIWELLLVTALAVAGAGGGYFVFTATHDRALNKVAEASLSSAASASMEVYYQSGPSSRSFSYVTATHLAFVDGRLDWTAGTSSRPDVVSYYVSPWPANAHPEVIYLAVRSRSGACFAALQVESDRIYSIPAGDDRLGRGTWYAELSGQACDAKLGVQVRSWYKGPGE
ncbi:MAG: hypothetical protein ACYDGY_10585 [Acidimicrobiales bacterium]